jgi:hypothetical protein
LQSASIKYGTSCDYFDGQFDVTFDGLDDYFKGYSFIISLYMKSKLPDYMKSLVKQQWLQSLPRDTITTNKRLRAESATNTTNEREVRFLSLNSD